MPAWIPASEIKAGPLHAFSPGALLIEPTFEDGAAVTLGLRVNSASAAHVLHLTPTPDAPTGRLSALNPADDERGYALSSDVPLEIEFDLHGKTSVPAFSLNGVGHLALGPGGGRLVCAAVDSRGALYVDPMNWTLNGFSGGAEPRVLLPKWRLVAAFASDRRISLFET